MTNSAMYPMPGRLGLPAAAGSVLALAGVYWDDSWHTDVGRDSFFSPPHLLLYGGVLLTALCVATWGISAWRAAGWGWHGVAVVLRQRGLVLAGVGGLATLASAPVDEAWHRLYGRDAVLWSPPHLFGVAATLALSVGLLIGLRAAQDPLGRTARLLTAAGVLGVLQVPVLEYDSDVPQFAALWYLPVAALGVAAGVALLADLTPARWALTAAAAILTLVRAAVVGRLAALDHSLTLIPPIVVVAVLVDLLVAYPVWLRVLVAAFVTPLVWWPALLAQAGNTTTVPAGDMPAVLGLALLAGLVVLAFHADLTGVGRRARRTGASAATLIAVALGFGGPLLDARPAYAHDPGQGREVARGVLTVTRDDSRATLRFERPAECVPLRPVATVARRAGQEVHGPLDLDVVNPCTAVGTVSLPQPGRWIVYAEFSDASLPLYETWLAVSDGERASDVRPLYQPSPAGVTTGRNLAGSGLLIGVLALLLACLRLARSDRVATTGPRVGGLPASDPPMPRPAS